jgi:hypothetical protein
MPDIGDWIWLRATCRCRTCGAVERANWPVRFAAGCNLGPHYLQCDACGEMTLWPITTAHRIPAPPINAYDVRDALTTIERRHWFS